MKVLLKAPISPYSGYGVDSIGLIKALIGFGVDVYLQPAHVDPPLPEYVTNLLQKRLEAPFDLLICHQDPSLLYISPEARRASDVTVAWSMFEFTTLDVLSGRSKVKKNIKNFDAVVAYDKVTTEALSKHVGRTPVVIQQGGYNSEDWPSVERDWFSDRFGFCQVGQLGNLRKDVWTTINAFQELKQEHPIEFEPAELHLKDNSSTPTLHPMMEEWCPKLRVHYSVWPTEVLREFYANQHVLLAPSRGEGKNMPALEFMSTGGTAIATNFGGHQTWLNSLYSYPLDCTLKGEENFPKCLSARASKEHLKELMLHTFRNRSEAKLKGMHASQQIPDLCDWANVVENLFIKLETALPGNKGFALRAKFLECQSKAVVL